MIYENSIVGQGERSLFNAAIDEAYPIPDSPHTSVMQRTNEARVAFMKGWDKARASLTPTAPPPIAEREQEENFIDVVADLREYASNPGYSHNDYADTMRRAAHCIESLRAMFWHYEMAGTPTAPQAASHQAKAAKLPERDPSKPAEQQGIFRKFTVERTDGQSRPGNKHYGCRYYVLDLTHDQYAPAAMRAYAAACRSTHPKLADDIESEFGAPQAATTASASSTDGYLNDDCDAPMKGGACTECGFGPCRRAAPVQAAQPALPAEYKTCQTCDGKGAFYGETCDTCAGVGKVIAAPGAAQTTDKGQTNE